MSTDPSDVAPGDPDDVAAFAAKFRLDTLTLRTSRHWRLSLRPGQVTLGSMVISAAGPQSGAATAFGQLDAEAGSELVRIMGEAETIGRALGAARMNFLALMLQDPIVHLHVLPRYAAPVTFAGREWVDADWPRPAALAPQELGEGELLALHADLMTLVAGVLPG